MRAPGVEERAARIRLRFGGLAALTLVGLAACGGRASSSPTGPVRTGSIAADSDRFPHQLHTGNDPTIRAFQGRGLGCGDCHPSEAVRAGKIARPGSNNHYPCDVCHKDEFYKPPGAFCRNCHSSVDPTTRGATQMQPYPERGAVKVLASAFSHELHLDTAAMDHEVGFHVDCADCHLRAANTRDPQLPMHLQCARCHTAKAAAQQKLDMANCQGCHVARDVDLKRGRKLYTGDLIFAHAKHETDLHGNAIACRACHEAVPAARRPEDVPVPAMQRCATCHEDASKTPDRVRMAKCNVCHQAVMSGVAPRDHLIGSDVPEDHTLAFRTDHASAASAKDARCSYCHGGLSGSSRDSCNECHQTWAPRDHKLGWRDDTHGREAEVDRDRCATCHQADFCTACHAIPPRSHQPLGEFSRGGHAEIARFDLKSCFACHTYEDTCSRCHREAR